MTREQNWKRIAADTFQQWCWLVEVWLAFVVAFVLAKPCFMLYQAPAQQFTGSDVISVVGHGLSLDLSTSLYFILLPYLVVLLGQLVPLLPKKGQMGCFRLLRIILRCYFAIASVLVAVAIVVDTSLYEFWGFKLDASVSHYASLPYLSLPAFCSSFSRNFYLTSHLSPLTSHLSPPSSLPFCSSLSSLSAYGAARVYRRPTWGKCISRRISSSTIRLSTPFSRSFPPLASRPTTSPPIASSTTKNCRKTSSILPTVL